MNLPTVPGPAVMSITWLMRSSTARSYAPPRILDVFTFSSSVMKSLQKLLPVKLISNSISKRDKHLSWVNNYQSLKAWRKDMVDFA